MKKRIIHTQPEHHVDELGISGSWYRIGKRIYYTNGVQPLKHLEHKMDTLMERPDYVSAEIVGWEKYREEK